uniref:DNA-directed RNA polymerase III subunit RPC5 n=1 Tax=Timema shepardi TaxID=629360 RepID=A0A7R9AVK2_TIMSH|nr:unnamed protein product [Timema shepardi]
MNEEEDDPVIKEYPLYLSQMLHDKLFLYQYPLQQHDRGYDESNILKLRYSSPMASLVLTDNSQLTALKRYQTKLCIPTPDHMICKNMCLAAVTFDGQNVGIYSSPMASLVLTDSSQMTADGFEKLPDHIMYPYAEPYDLQKHVFKQLSVSTKEDTGLLYLNVDCQKSAVSQHQRSHGAGYCTRAYLSESCIKPQHQEVRLELGIDTRNPNYDTSKGEQFAINVDGSGNKKDGKKTDEKYFDSNVMDKLVLTSTRAVMNASNYAVALVHENELHVTALRGLLHLRPSFAYLDKSDKRAKEEAKDQGEDISGGEEEEEAKQVTVKFKRQENDRIKQARERSFGFLSKRSAEEPWYHTEFHATSSETSESVNAFVVLRSAAEDGEIEVRISQWKSKLYCSKTTEKVCELSVSSDDYLKTLLPEDLEDDSVKTSTYSVPLKNLRLLPLVDQVKLLLKEAKLLQFSHLLRLLSKEQDPVNVLRTVQQVAVLVQGNWVVRSDVLYPKDTTSGTYGVPAEPMCRGRDYILYLFTEKRYIDRIRVTPIIKLPAEEVKEIFTQVARLQPGHGWELALPVDKDFINKYPEVVQRQQMWWESKQKQLSEALSECGNNSLGKARRKSTRDSSIGSSDSESGKPRRRRSLKESDSEANKPQKGKSRESDSEMGRPRQDKSRESNTGEMARPVRRKSHRESLSSDNESSAEGGTRQKNSVKVQRRTKKVAPAVKAEPMET